MEKSDRGWAIGRNRHRVTEAGRAFFPDHRELSALSFHQDQVIDLPPEARVILHNDHSPHGGLAYPFAALSVQFHPEFEPEYISVLLDRMDRDSLSDTLVRQSRTGLDQPIDNAEVARTFARFYRLHCGGEAQAG